MEKLIKLGSQIHKIFRNFYLAGGTAIMLKFNHRQSRDLDFFSEKTFSFLRISQKIRRFFGVQKEERGEDNIDFYIEGIRVSFVFFPFLSYFSTRRPEDDQYRRRGANTRGVALCSFLRLRSRRKRWRV